MKDSVMPDNFFTLDPIRKFLGVYVFPPTETELPDNYDPANLNTGSRNTAPLAGFRRSSIPTNIPTRLIAYRGDERRGGVETLPMARFDANTPLKTDAQFWHGTSKGKQLPATPEINQLYAFARITGAAKKLGLPSLTPDQFAALVLKEGRPDAGFNAFQPQAKPDIDFRKKLDSYNIPAWQKDYLGLMNYASRVAKAKGLPFEAVWNGLGRNVYGKSGTDYANTISTHRNAIANPKNQAFRSFIYRSFADGEKNGLPLMADRARDTDPYLKSDPNYTYHTREGRLSRPTQVIPPSVKNWFRSTTAKIGF